MLSNYVTSAVRTGVPALVAWVAGWLLARGIDIPAETRDWAVGGLTFLILMGYYLLARGLERRWPRAGFLLGVPTAPVYAPALIDAGVVNPQAPAVITDLEKK